MGIEPGEASQLVLRARVQTQGKRRAYNLSPRIVHIGMARFTRSRLYRLRRLDCEWANIPESRPRYVSLYLLVPFLRLLASCPYHSARHCALRLRGPYRLRCWLSFAHNSEEINVRVGITGKMRYLQKTRIKMRKSGGVDRGSVITDRARYRILGEFEDLPCPLNCC